MPAVYYEEDLELLAELEAEWQIWLEEIYPNICLYDFSPYPGYHCDFWDWVWSIRPNIKPPAFLTVWPRRGAKSSTVELSCVATGAKRSRRYALYISGTQDQADDHVSSVGSLMESPTLAKYYPALSQPRVGKHGTVRGWRRNRLWTQNGFVIDAMGLDSAARGAKLEDQRPDYIIIDDIDEETDTPAAVEKKIKILTRALLPAGSEDVAIVGAQNLVHRGSVFDQLVSYKTGFLANRIEAEPIPALLDFEYEKRGRKTIILKGTPTWDGLSVAACQALIDDITVEAFNAECQHAVHVPDAGAIYPMWSEEHHVISWSQFLSVFGRYTYNQRAIPVHWQLACGMDWGSTPQHPTVTTWFAKAALNGPLTGKVFAYRELVCIKETPRQVIEKIIALEAPMEEADRMKYRVNGHDALSERDTFAVHHNMTWGVAKPDRNGGIAQMKDYLQIDFTQPHPFKPSVKGCPNIFYIVDDDQLEAPRDDRGFARHRAEYPVYHYDTPAPGEAAARIVPYAFFNDAADSDRIVAGLFFSDEAPLTPEELFEQAMPPALKREVVEELPAEDKGAAFTLREFHRHRLNKEDKGKNDLNWIFQRRNKV